MLEINHRRGEGIQRKRGIFPKLQEESAEAGAAQGLLIRKSPIPTLLGAGCLIGAVAMPPFMATLMFNIGLQLFDFENVRSAVLLNTFSRV